MSNVARGRSLATCCTRLSSRSMCSSPKLLQPRERRRGHDRKRKHIEESAGRDRGFLSKRGEQSRSELLCDNRVSVAPRVCALYVGVVLVDGEVIRRNPSKSDISSTECG